MLTKNKESNRTVYVCYMADSSPMRVFDTEEKAIEWAKDAPFQYFYDEMEVE